MLYLDTRIYEMVAERDAADRLRSLLDHRDLSVLVSGFNLLEAWNQDNLRSRTAKVRAMTAIGSAYVHEPETYLQGLQVRDEIRRLRPTWLDRLPDPSRQQWVYQRRDAYLDMRRAAQRAPGTRPSEYDYLMANIYERKGVAKHRQQGLRNRVPQMVPNHRRRAWDRAEWVDDGVDLPSLTEGMAPEETFWRASAYETYKRVILTRSPERIDLREWPNPAIRRRIAPDDYAAFWMRDVDGEIVSITKVIGLTEHYQADYQVRHSNLIDLHHAVHLLDCDLFVTADRDFYAILEHVRTHLPVSAVPVLVHGPEGGASSDPALTIIDTIDGALAAA